MSNQSTLSPGSTNPVVDLEADSLYISTSQLLSSAGKFHWSFFITDSTGVATKHHWAVISSPTSPVPAEGWISTVIDPVTTFSKSGVTTLTFYKIKGFSAIPKDELAKLLYNVFDSASHPSGYQHVRDNRKAGITCRTWALRVFQKLLDAGYIVRPNGAPTLTEIERDITTKSSEIEANNVKGIDKPFVGEI